MTFGQALIIGTVIGTLITALVNVPRIHAWERANGYPYGHMCDSIFTGFVNTCRR